MKIIKKIFAILILMILLPILFVNGVILINSYIHPDDIPSFFGWKPFIVLSGSMETQIFAGDIAVVKAIDTKDLKVNDIIAFRYNDIVVTHRIVNIIVEDEVTKYITKGDNNNAEDTGFVLPDHVEGIYKFKISRLGNLAIFIQTPIGMIICLSIPILLLFFIQAIDSKRNQKYMNEKNSIEQSMKEEIERLKKQNEELMKK